MALTYKHAFGTMNKVRVTIVEKGVTKERMEFLKNILEYNRFKVQTEEVVSKEEGGESTFIIGVEDMVFNPIIWIYDRKLMLPNGQYVTHKFWEKGEGDNKPQYWTSIYNS